MTQNAYARRKVGGTNVEVSALGFGGAPVGGFRYTVSEQQAADTVSAAAEAGVSYFDTSPFYGYGRSELVFGHALRARPRDSYVLSTKIGRWMTPLRAGETVAGLRSGGLPFKPTYDYSRDGVLRSMEQSMLRLTRIDIVFIHDADVTTHGSEAAADHRFKEVMEGCYPALAELRSAGVVGAIGTGLNETAMTLRFAREADLDCAMLAGRYTLLEQGALPELLPLCARKNISILLAAPFNSGILAVGAQGGATYDYKPAPGGRSNQTSRGVAERRPHVRAHPAVALG
jgi:D-threo-aldose 1-dehydrogenase